MLEAAKCLLSGWDCALVASSGQTISMFDVKAFIQLHNIMDRRANVSQYKESSVFSELRKKKMDAVTTKLL